MIFNNFKIAINGRRTTSVVVRINYLHMVIRGEALIRFDELARNNNGITCAHLEHIMEGLLGYFSPINALSKQKRVMCRAIYKPRDLPFKSFTAQLKELNYYLPLFPISINSNNMAPKELNNILLHTIPNGCLKQSYLQG